MGPHDVVSEECKLTLCEVREEASPVLGEHWTVADRYSVSMSWTEDSHGDSALHANTEQNAMAFIVSCFSQPCLLPMEFRHLYVDSAPM